ncbi:MAG: SDR family NAD(P)-dependent oxidoreductase, partial [Planctomycetota bacterium]
MSDLFCLKGNVAVVIGGTGSLGGAMADALANAGATTIVCGRNEENGRRRVQEIMDAGGTADFAVADALSVDSLKACCDGEISRSTRVH